MGFLGVHVFPALGKYVKITIEKTNKNKLNYFKYLGVTLFSCLAFY